MELENAPTPVTESAAPSTPAPVENTAPVTTSAPQEIIAPEGAEPQFTSDQDRREYLREKLAWRAEHPEKPEEKPTEAATPPEVKPAEEAKTDAEKKPDEKAAETKTEEVAADPLDKIGPLPAEKIAEALKVEANKAALDAMGLPGAALIQNARDAAQATQFRELFPTLEIAQVAKQGSENFAVLDEKFPAIKDESGYNDFMMNTLVPMSFIRDADGNPIPEPGMPGQFKTDGSVARFIKMSNDVEFNQLKLIATNVLANREDGKEYSQDLIAAVDFIQEFRNNDYQIPGAKPAPGTEKPSLPPEVQAELERHRSAERERNQNSAAEAKQKEDAFEDSITNVTYERMSPLLKDALDLSSLTDFEKETIADRVWKDMSEKLASNGDFRRAQNQMMSRRELSDGVKQQRVTQNLTSMKALYLDILDKYLAKAGTSRVEKNKALQAKIATQKDAARMEPKTGAVAAPGAPASLSSEQRWEKARELARADNQGEDPSNAQIVKALLKLPQSA